MIILYITFQSENVVMFISICSLTMRTDVCKRSCIFNDEIGFIAIWYFLNYRSTLTHIFKIKKYRKLDNMYNKWVKSEHNSVHSITIF